MHETMVGSNYLCPKLKVMCLAEERCIFIYDFSEQTCFNSSPQPNLPANIACFIQVDNSHIYLLSDGSRGLRPDAFLHARLIWNG